MRKLGCGKIRKFAKGHIPNEWEGWNPKQLGPKLTFTKYLACNKAL